MARIRRCRWASEDGLMADWGKRGALLSEEWLGLALDFGKGEINPVNKNEQGPTI